jgi:hypothetical protein
MQGCVGAHEYVACFCFAFAGVDSALVLAPILAYLQRRTTKAMQVGGDGSRPRNQAGKLCIPYVTCACVLSLLCCHGTRAQQLLSARHIDTAAEMDVTTGLSATAFSLPYLAEPAW